MVTISPSRAAAFGLMMAAGLMAVPAAHAANEIQPGLWQDTETGEPNGKKDPPKVTTDCVTAEDAKDPVKQIQASMKEQAQSQQCKNLDVKQNGNVILFEMNCGDSKQGSIEMTMTYTVHSPQHTTSVGKSNGDGPKNDFDQHHRVEMAVGDVQEVGGQALA